MNRNPFNKQSNPLAWARAESNMGNPWPVIGQMITAIMALLVPALLCGGLVAALLGCAK